MCELPNEFCHDYTRLMRFFFHNSRVTNEKMHEWDDACVTKERHISHEREEVFITKDATYESRMRAPLTIRKLLKNQILLYFSFLRRVVRDSTVFSFGTHQSFDLWRCPEQKNMNHERGDVRVMNTCAVTIETHAISRSSLMCLFTFGQDKILLTSIEKCLSPLLFYRSLS